ncbi:1,4-alpha-glucan branching protein domain-containing protein [Sulfoacidibacillus thermotolerans]|uniref:Glycosyl transferase family 1 n=1 Tax=Sulfoacidibacillus thermotolerans TaxID=1765684 RepID=A0A2U3D6Q5_SULT2|nr:1,4-alpha-glucan branching protein domain-containing protein [Sulfoacidibacillus thermotolerans]PWI56933.1 glycosyl transferase family 1 [Sulfoacidibacillus thermotolerans]
MNQGYVCLVLHAHLPYVRHNEDSHGMEQRWLFEALTESYLPLLRVFDGLIRDGVDFRVTMSVSPTLLSMWTDELLQERYVRHMEQLIAFTEQEINRTRKDDSAFYSLACYYREKFSLLLKDYESCQGNLVERLRALQDLGMIELITSAATHAYLPLVQTREARRAQLRTALDLHTAHFGQRPKGIWLPECGFVPGLDELLRECGIEFFFTDTQGVAMAQPRSVFGTLSPVLTPSGVAAFARDASSAHQVWSSTHGYPGDFSYREYYRDLGFDLPLHQLQSVIHPDGTRVHTGVKYYRITGSERKEPYDPLLAREKAALHAAHFLQTKQQQLAAAKRQMGRSPIVVCPYDAELFGHWWYEGPIWIEQLLRQMSASHVADHGLSIQALTPSEYLRLYADYQVCDLPLSSWGRGGVSDVWLGEDNAWIYPALHVAEHQMIELADRFLEPVAAQEQALNQAARELLLAQSSDWAFIMDNKTVVDYAVRRVKRHVNAFTKLYQMLIEGVLDSEFVHEIAMLDPLFPHIDYRIYRTQGCLVEQPTTPHLSRVHSKRSVWMLTWEYPPLTVGGLARHVYDLSRHLVRAGWEVHVVTAHREDCPYEEMIDGVHVHRVRPLQPDGGHFYHWVFALNLALIDACQAMIERGQRVDVLHAHDWLVSDAARMLKQRLQVPLIATLHATEYGRNHGIYTDLQRKISSIEGQLTTAADRVIVCSQFMKKEVQQVFALPSEKMTVIANGVDAQELMSNVGELEEADRLLAAGKRTILYVGRLVREKGVHLLIAAASRIFTKGSDVQIVILGQGPASEELQAQVRANGLSAQVHFLGFVSDARRNAWLSVAQIAVFPSLYEPFGIVALEAMRFKTPVVAADVGGLCEVVRHEETGLTFYAGNPDSLADQIMRLLDDPELSRRLSERAYEVCLQSYDWQALARRTVAVYEQSMDAITQKEATVG